MGFLAQPKQATECIEVSYGLKGYSYTVRGSLPDGLTRPKMTSLIPCPASSPPYLRGDIFEFTSLILRRRLAVNKSDNKWNNIINVKLSSLILRLTVNKSDKKWNNIIKMLLHRHAYVAKFARLKLSLRLNVNANVSDYKRNNNTKRHLSRGSLRTRRRAMHRFCFRQSTPFIVQQEGRARK